MSTLFCISAHSYRRVATFNHVKRNNISESLRMFYANIGWKFLHGIEIYKKEVATVESYFQSTICEKRWGDDPSFFLAHLFFSSSSIFFFRSRSRGDREKKRIIYSRLVIKSKQKGIDVIEVGSGTFFSLFFSLRLVGLKLSKRNCIRENGKDHVRDCIIQYRHGKSIYTRPPFHPL